jgi:MoxR-like ATPase
MPNNSNDNTNNDTFTPSFIASPSDNIKTLDLVGSVLLAAQVTNKPLTPEVIESILQAVANVRIYCTFRDQKELTDAGSLRLIAEARAAAQQKQKTDVSTDAAAEEILADLRKSGVIG